MEADLSSLIIELRSRLQLSQERLAARLRVSLPTVNRWEKGKARPDPRAVHLIEQFLSQLGDEFRDLYDRYFPEQDKIMATTTGVERRNRRRKSDPQAPESLGQNPPKQVLDTKAMEGLLWKAACSIRGEKDAPKFKDYILPLIFIKRLSKKEFTDLLRSQIVISNPGRGGARFAPYAFTEQGVAMLSSVLRSKRAVQVNIGIMRAFVRLRELLATHKDLARKLEELEKKYNKQFQVVFDAIRALMEPPARPRKQVGFRPSEKR